MIEFLKAWVLNIVTLAILIVILEILIPTGKTKKFINLISGFILLIAIINPFISLINKGVDIKEFQMLDSNMLDKKEISQDSKILEDAQMKQVTEVYREKVISQINESIKEIDGISDVSADVIINDDYKSNNFGEIKRVYLKLKLQEKGNEVKPITKVNKIEIGNSAKSSEIGKETQTKDISDELKKKISGKLDELLGVKENNIVISVQKE